LEHDDMLLIIIIHYCWLNISNVKDIYSDSMRPRYVYLILLVIVNYLK